MSKRILREGEAVHLPRGPWTSEVTSIRAEVAEYVAAHPDATLHSAAEALDRAPQAISRAANWARDRVGIFGPERPLYVDPDSPEAIRARNAATTTHNLAVHERAKRGRPAAGSEAVKVPRSVRLTESEAATIERLRKGRSTSATIRAFMLAGLEANDSPGESPQETR